MEPASCNSVVSNDTLPPSSSISLYLNCSGIRAWDCYLDRLSDYANCTGTLYPEKNFQDGLSVTTEFMYQNNAITYQDGLTTKTDFFTRVTLIVSSDNQEQYTICSAGCNDGDSWSFDIDLGPDLEYITQSNARWKVKGGWSIVFGPGSTIDGPPPANRTLSRMQNYLFRTESIGGVVTPTVCNKTTDKPWTVDQRIKVPYTAEYMMYTCIDDSNDDDSKAPFIYASTAGSAILVVVIMMAQFL